MKMCAMQKFPCKYLIYLCPRVQMYMQNFLHISLCTKMCHHHHRSLLRIGLHLPYTDVQFSIHYIRFLYVILCVLYECTWSGAFNAKYQRKKGRFYGVYLWHLYRKTQRSIVWSLSVTHHFPGSVREKLHHHMRKPKQNERHFL